MKKFILFILLFTFFAFTSDVFAASVAHTCYYSDNSEQYKAEIRIKTDGKADGYYTKWEGKDDNNHESVAYWEDKNLESTNWDYWYYKFRNCPPYVYVKKTGTGYQQVCPSTKNTDDGDGWKPLSLVNGNGVVQALSSNPREVGELYFKNTENNEWNFDVVNKSGTTSSLTLNGKATYNMYIKTNNGKVIDGKYMNHDKLECHSENSSIIKNVKVSWEDKYPNDTFARLTFETDQAGSTNVTCTYTKDDKTIATKSLSVTVSSTDIRTWSKQDLKCEYDLVYNNTPVAGALVEIFNYKDGYVSDPTINYYIMGQANQYIPVSEGTRIDTYQHYSQLNKKLAYKVSTANYFAALKQQSDCPVLYVYKDGSHLGITTAANDSTPILPTTFYRRTSTDIWHEITNSDRPTEDPENVNNGCRVPVTYTLNENKVLDAAVNFMRTMPSLNATDYKYTYIPLDGSSIEQNIPTLNASLNIQTAFSVYGYEGGSSSSSTYLRFDSAYLKAIYDNYETCTVPKACVWRITDFDYGLGYSSSDYIYGVTFDTDECKDDPNASVIEEDDVEVGNGLNNGVSGKTDELDVINNRDNAGTVNCDDIFGSEGNRNDLYNVVHTIATAIRILTPIIFILLSMLDFTKATADDEFMPKAKKQFTIRGIIAVIIFLLPTFISFIFEILGKEDCPI